MIRYLTIILMLCGASAFAAEHVESQFIASVDGVAAGKAFYVGVVCHVDPGWHIYWRNPGDSGLATSVKFEAPAGFEVSEMMYPVPEKFMQPGDLIAYGYAETALFVAKVTPPAQLASSDKISIKATVRYLVCKDVCVPAGKELELSIPASGSGNPANDEVFKTWLAKIPVSANAPDSPATVTTAGTVGNTLAVTVHWKNPVEDVEFFPGKSQSLKISDITVQNKSKTTAVTFDARLLAGQKLDVDTLASVIAYTDKEGVRRGLSVDIPVKQ